MSSEFEIKRLLELTQNHKYAATVAAFEVVDLIDQIVVPKSFMNRKPSIKAMQIMSENTVQYGFISDEQREELYIELGGEPEYESAVPAPSATAVAEKIFAPSEPVDESESIVSDDTDEETSDKEDDSD